MEVGRPDIIAGYGIATTDEGQLPWSWAEERLTSSRNYWIATTRADGRPHAMPVWALWIGDAIVFSTDPDSHKARHVAERPEVVVHLESGEETVIVEGRAVRVAGTDLPAGFVAAYATKYDVELDTSEPSFGFYRVAPTTVLAWREADFPTSATRFTFS